MARGYGKKEKYKALKIKYPPKAQQLASENTPSIDEASISSISATVAQPNMCEGPPGASEKVPGNNVINDQQQLVKKEMREILKITRSVKKLLPTKVKGNEMHGALDMPQTDVEALRANKEMLSRLAVNAGLQTLEDKSREINELFDHFGNELEGTWSDTSATTGTKDEKLQKRLEQFKRQFQMIKGKKKDVTRVAKGIQPPNSAVNLGSSVVNTSTKLQLLSVNVNPGTVPLLSLDSTCTAPIKRMTKVDLKEISSDLECVGDINPEDILQAVVVESALLAKWNRAVAFGETEVVNVSHLQQVRYIVSTENEKCNFTTVSGCDDHFKTTFCNGISTFQIKIQDYHYLKMLRKHSVSSFQIVGRILRHSRHGPEFLHVYIQIFKKHTVPLKSAQTMTLSRRVCGQRDKLLDMQGICDILKGETNIYRHDYYRKLFEELHLSENPLSLDA